MPGWARSVLGEGWRAESRPLTRLSYSLPDEQKAGECGLRLERDSSLEENRDSAGQDSVPDLKMLPCRQERVRVCQQNGAGPQKVLFLWKKLLFREHSGLGYVWNMAEGHDLDVYGKYIWTRVQGTDDTLTTADKYEFDDIDSNRVRLGVRYTYTGSERFSPYIGAAFEHEFSGTCESTVYGHNVAAPQL